MCLNFADVMHLYIQALLRLISTDLSYPIRFIGRDRRFAKFWKIVGAQVRSTSPIGQRYTMTLAFYEVHHDAWHSTISFQPSPDSVALAMPSPTSVSVHLRATSATSNMHPSSSLSGLYLWSLLLVLQRLTSPVDNF